MSSAHEQTLRGVAEQTFEALAFLFPLGPDEEGSAPPQADPSPGAGETCLVRVGFDGPFHGSLEVELGEEMLKTVTVNMLGFEEGDAPDPATQRDALCELANVICGNLLPEIGGAEAVFDVEAPQIVASPACDADAEVTLATDEGPAVVRLHLDAPVPAGK